MAKRENKSTDMCWSDRGEDEGIERGERGGGVESRREPDG